MDRERWQEIQKKNGKSNKAVVIGVIIAIAVGVGVATYFISATGTVQKQGITGSATESSRGLVTLVDWKHVHGIGIDPADPNIIYVATHAGLYKSSGGSGWIIVGTDRSDLTGFAIHPYDSKVMYSSGQQGENLEFRKSADGGLTWLTLSSVPSPPARFHAMTISAASPNILYNSPGRELFGSQDGGESWERVNSPSDNVISLAAHPKDEKVVFAGTANGIYRSDDQGFTWRQLDEFKGLRVSALAFGREGILYAFVASQMHLAAVGMVRSSDDGNNWTELGWKYRAEVVFNIAVDQVNQDTLYAYGALHLPSGEIPDSLYKTTNGGQSWSLIATNNKSHPALG